MIQKQKNKTSAFSSKSLDLISRNRTKIHLIANRVIILLIVGIMISYVISVNDLSIKGFVLAEKKADVVGLEEENERYELEAMALESLENINRKAVGMGLVKVDNIDYFSIVDGVVAKR